jgi:hypothetical protein
MAWKIETHGMTPKMLAAEDCCDLCEEVLAKYVMFGETSPYDGNQFYTVLCASCIKEEEHYYREINERG